MRRATSPPGVAMHRAPPRRRRGDTFLRVVKVTVIAAASLAALLAFMAPTRAKDARYSPRCGVGCSRTVAHVDADGDYDGH